MQYAHSIVDQRPKNKIRKISASKVCLFLNVVFFECFSIAWFCVWTRLSVFCLFLLWIFFRVVVLLFENFFLIFSNSLWSLSSPDSEWKKESECERVTWGLSYARRRRVFSLVAASLLSLNPRHRNTVCLTSTLHGEPKIKKKSRWRRKEETVGARSSQNRGWVTVLELVWIHSCDGNRKQNGAHMIDESKLDINNVPLRIFNMLSRVMSILRRSLVQVWRN